MNGYSDFVDKENGEPGIQVAPKDGLKLGSGLSLRKAAKKALGTVNRATEKSVKTNETLKQKQTTFSTKKMTEKTIKAKTSVPASDDSNPEIEKFFPFNLLDFESFDLPKEHRIAQLPLNGVFLVILDEEGHHE
ncbi:Securin [Camelus dromedarius]|uniref:Securin n=1 Tax=Camelus dromedarius TaxID=9838 RepID=A0A5N4DZW4_CAMDR|nr:Securin [Camelus dromedarius]